MTEVQEHANYVIETVRVREAVGVVHSREQLEKLIDRLTTSGFDRSSIDLMASQDAITRKLKTVYPDLTAAADVPGVPRRKLVLPSDQDSATALVFGSLISMGTMGAALPIVALRRGSCDGNTRGSRRRCCRERDRKDHQRSDCWTLRSD
jgi:hypothetical protein